MEGAPRGEGEPRERPSSREAAKAEVAAVVQGVREGSGEAKEVDELPSSYDDLLVKDLEQDIGLKRTYALILLGLLGVQLMIADAVFVAYAWAGAHWKLSASVIDVWLGATLVEVVGIVLVATRYLLPGRDVQP